MAEPFEPVAVRERSALRTGLRAYRLVSLMWVRSMLAYPLSFALNVFAQAAITGLDFVVILLMFSQVDALGGYDLADFAVLYGLSSVSFGLCNLFLGLAQIAADRFSLNRLGRTFQGLAVLVYGLSAAGIDWDAGRVLIIPYAVVSGAAIFGAVYVAGAAFQFVATDAAEVENAFTYGGQTMLQYPPTVFAGEVVRAVTFVLPLSFVNWVPGAYLLDRPVPLGLPVWCALLPPLVAVAALALAGLAWRAGLRGYRSTGS
ncbi:ABC transporter permease [Streptomyces sp. NEAU-H3]|uniref:ABC transporter permease n=1 Tax=Streptomyces sp. NEAU-H3 TaxID=2720636 RepID=UPI00143ADC15|nr:ABC-2 family transporter protein [Streptomyces sp. NEAU-H3]NJA56472.1 transporter [Streptomyces sp. NEAU-H3]